MNIVKIGGMQCFDPDSLSPNKLVFAPWKSRSGGGNIRIVGFGNILRIRYKSDKTTTIQVYDETKETSHNYTINSTNGEYKNLNCYLSTDISNYTPNDILQIGFGAGYNVFMDTFYFVN